MAEINFDAEVAKLPDLNETARYFEKDALQQRYHKKCSEEGHKEEEEVLDVINALKLNMNVPFFEQMLN